MTKFLNLVVSEPDLQVLVYKRHLGLFVDVVELFQGGVLGLRRPRLQRGPPLTPVLLVSPGQHCTVHVDVTDPLVHPDLVHNR